MQQPLNPEHEAEARSGLHSVMNELLAHRDLQDSIHLQTMLLACRLRLRSLQNMLLSVRREAAFAPMPCDIRGCTEDLCAASDLLLAPFGRRLCFDAPEQAIVCLCAPRDYAWMLLELICNAALHCDGEEIRVALEPRGRRNPACVLTVECDGTLDLEALHAAGIGQNSGTAALRRTAWLHRGTLLWLAQEGKSVAALRLPGVRGESRGYISMPDLPDAVDLLSDPCSPVYIALAQAIGGLIWTIDN